MMMNDYDYGDDDNCRVEMMIMVILAV